MSSKIDVLPSGKVDWSVRFSIFYASEHTPQDCDIDYSNPTSLVSSNFDASRYRNGRFVSS